MELIKISSCKLKIMMTPSDMSHFELNRECFGEDRDQTNRAVRGLLRDLKVRLGMEFDDRNLCVRFFPSKEGGCEIFLYNLQKDGTVGDGADANRKTSVENSLLPHTRRHTKECFQRDFAYRFDSLDCLLCVCSRLFSIGYICESSAFRDLCSNYFLFLSTLTDSPFSIPDEIGFIAEYGRIENARGIKLYLQEYGYPICSCEAIVRLANLA